MRLTFITHSSFLLEGEKAALLFDYYGEGVLPETDKPLYILSSHFHHDHYNKCIFELNAESYILSDTIKLKEIPEEKRKITTRVHEGERINNGYFTVKTFGSTDCGISFYITLDNKHIYFAGDNNIWYWDEEDEHMKSDFFKMIDGMDSVDIAFLPVDPRLEENAFLTIEAFDKIYSPDIIIPMHMWKDYSIAAKAKEHLNKVLLINHENQIEEI